jgi:hypothetical protein
MSQINPQPVGGVMIDQLADPFATSRAPQAAAAWLLLTGSTAYGGRQPLGTRLGVRAWFTTYPRDVSRISCSAHIAFINFGKKLAAYLE